MNGIMFLLGLLFGFGLLLSGMSNPQKVQDFLDVFGRWDASLAFVMGGAILVTLIAFRGSRSAKPLCAPAFQEPATTRIDRRLLAGSALFGIGWGL
ncbi:MAG TPA: YeeE/YedE family protein, partial [Neisseria sp.]|nr:YeeE/YedE family protein [Neisseria sp.]